MKKFANNSDVIEAFVAGDVLEGSNRAGSLFFEGGTLYSYGHHYAIATVYDCRRAGKRDAFVNTTKVSVTTSKQVNQTRAALMRAGFRVSESSDPRVSLVDAMRENAA